MTEATRSPRAAQVEHGYPSCVFTHRSARTLIRTFTAASVVGAVTVASPALADTPIGWPDAPDVSALDFLLVVLLIPLGLAIVIALAAALPDIIRGDAYRKGELYTGEDQWFGGPRQGIAPGADAADASDKGGASARW